MMLKPSYGIEKQRKLQSLFRPYLDHQDYDKVIFDRKLTDDAPETAKEAFEEYKILEKKDADERERLRKMGFIL